jgi:hypothetical protein
MRFRGILNAATNLILTEMEQVPNDEALAGCDGATSIILFQMDVIHGLTVSEIHPDAVPVADDPLARFPTIARRTSLIG